MNCVDTPSATPNTPSEVIQKWEAARPTDEPLWESNPGRWGPRNTYASMESEMTGIHGPSARRDASISSTTPATETAISANVGRPGRSTSAR